MAELRASGRGRGLGSGGVSIESSGQPWVAVADRRLQGRRFELDVFGGVGLRASWNGGYLNAFLGDGFRVLPSVDVLAARLRLTPSTSTTAVSLRGSLLDPLAPLTDLAMRRTDLDYDRQGLLWLDVVRPRLEVGVSLPDVARRLVLVSGVSMRMSAPFQGGVGFPGKPPTTATYLTPLSSGPARSEGFTRFVEANVGLAYVS